MIETKDVQKQLLYKGNTFIKKTSYGSFIRVANKEYKIKEAVISYDLLLLIIRHLQEPKRIQLVYEKVEQDNFRKQDIHKAVALLLKMDVITLTDCDYIDHSIFMYVLKNYTDHDDVLERFFQSEIQTISDTVLDHQKALIETKLDFFYGSKRDNYRSDNYLRIANSLQDLYLPERLQFDCVIIVTTFLKSNVVTIVRNKEELAYIIDVLSNKEQVDHTIGDPLFNLMVNYALLLLIDFQSRHHIFGNTFFYDEDLSVYNKSIQFIDKENELFIIKQNPASDIQQKEAIDQFIIKAKELYDITLSIDFGKTNDMENKVSAEWAGRRKRVTHTAYGEVLEGVIKQSLSAIILGYFQQGVQVAFGKEELYHQVIQHCVEKGLYKVKTESPLQLTGDSGVSMINGQLFKIEDPSKQKGNVAYRLSINTQLNEHGTKEYNAYGRTSKKEYDVFETILNDAGVFLTFWDDNDYFYKNGTFIYRVNAYE